MMQDNDNPPDTAGVSFRGTLPPSAKTAREIFAGLERIGKELGLPVLTLVAARMGLIDVHDAGLIFGGAVSLVLGGNFALRKAEQAGGK